MLEFKLGDKFPTPKGGILTIEGPRDRYGKCSFSIEWEASLQCSSCGLRPGEGNPPQPDGPTCNCGGTRTRKRAQQFYAVPEHHL